MRVGDNEPRPARSRASARIVDLLRQGRCFSFEFFPRTDEGEAQLRQTLVELAPLRPSFVSVTYGAGGTTRERTHDVVVELLRTTTTPPMAHLTCAGHTEEELRGILEVYRAEGITNILALRGDPPAELGLPPGDLGYASDLVDLIRDVGDFAVGVAAHPEGHPASTDRAVDRMFLAAKLSRADFAITQFALPACTSTPSMARGRRRRSSRCWIWTSPRSGPLSAAVPKPSISSANSPSNARGRSSTQLQFERRLASARTSRGAK
jgi:methylenetetrahydrofolate reductase (NADPH)